ncbi:class I SAM-dependent methyltransferase [Luteimonas sp. Y-2-2-4F]|nr:class I SAM-dependent methyltransferase [Luteimonas sp. Y-2-2-4F]MCD9031002.1 class I SAM-dependent methyltransferase [Luteimonas sp. Y-2-2-4F]
MDTLPSPEALAAQLRRPAGTDAEDVGARMSEANAAVNRRAVALLDVGAGQAVLEIGPGNGAFVPELLAAPGSRYAGVDWSPEMVAAANRRNARAVADGRARFVEGDAAALPFADAAFDRVLSVNTLYFWTEPQRVLAEIARVLRPGGRLCLAYGDRGFMQRLPFAAHGFALYDREDGTALLRAAGFGEVAHHAHAETVRGNAGDLVERDFHLLLARRG